MIWTSPAAEFSSSIDRLSSRLKPKVKFSMGEKMVIDALVEAIADRVIARVKEELSHPSPSRIQPALLNVKEAAIYIGRSEQAVQHLIFQKELPVVRLGRRVHLDRRDLDAWIDKNNY